MDEFKQTNEAPEATEENALSSAARERHGLSRAWRVGRWVLLLLILLPIIYYAVQVFIVLLPRMKTQTVMMDEMKDSITATGFVTLESIPVEGTGGVLYYTVPEGQRVSVGAEVAKVFSSASAAEAMAGLERVDEEIALLETAQGALAEGGDMDVFLRQMEDGLFNYIQVLETGRYSDLTAPTDEVALAANKLQVATGEAEEGFEARMASLTSERARLEALAVPNGTIAAPQTGYFVPATNGQDRIPKSHEELAELTPAALSAAMEAPASYYDGSLAGHIVEDYRWYFYTVLPEKEAEKFTEGMKLDIAFPDVSETVMPVVVEQLEPDYDSGEVKVVLLCEYNNPDILKLRLEKAELIFKTVKGLRVEKAALRVLEGERCVYVKFGNQVFQRKIEVLLEDENYFLVPNAYEEGVNEIQLYDVVVTDAGGVELYDKRIL